MNYQRFIFTLVLVIFGSIYCMDKLQAQSASSFSRMIEHELLSLDEAVQSVETNSSMSAANDEDGYFFKRFWLRIRARIERDIPGLAGFAVVPEIEILWEKQNPDGWEGYKIK